MALLLIASSAVLAVSAKTIYELYGYSYTILNNTSLSLCGWDNSSPELIVPDAIMGRYFTEIESRAFQGNTEITSLDLTQTSRLNFIGFYTFEGCSNISSDLIIPETVTTIREGAFKNCSSLPSVVINAAVTEIQRESFNNCTNLQTAVLPETVETIGILAFGNCTNLSRVDIPKSVSSIAQSAFYNDPNLTLGVWYGTYGYEYAKEQNIPYILLDEVKLGDANGDDNINIHDVTAIQRHVAEFKALDDLQAKAADVNGDGSITIEDATILQQYLAEYELSYPINQSIRADYSQCQDGI